MKLKSKTLGIYSSMVLLCYQNMKKIKSYAGLNLKPINGMNIQFKIFEERKDL